MVSVPREPAAKPDRSAPQPGAGVRFPPPLLYAAGFGAGVVAQAITPLPGLHPAFAVIAGVALVAAGSVLAPWGVVAFRRAGTTLAVAAASSRLVTAGPYRLTRNPIYVGFALIYGGAAIWTGATWALITLVGVITVIDRHVIASEERHLQAAFGADYDRFRTRTRRWI